MSKRAAVCPKCGHVCVFDSSQIKPVGVKTEYSEVPAYYYDGDGMTVDLPGRTKTVTNESIVIGIDCPKCGGPVHGGGDWQERDLVLGHVVDCPNCFLGSNECQLCQDLGKVWYDNGEILSLYEARLGWAAINNLCKYSRRRGKDWTIAPNKANKLMAPLNIENISGNIRKIADGWQRMGRRLWDYNGPVAWRAEDGFIQKERLEESWRQEIETRARKRRRVNPWSCYSEPFIYCKDYHGFNCKRPGPGRGAVVFWVPRLIPGSVGKLAGEQLKLLADLRRQFNLPDAHLSQFGNYNLLSALFLVHHRAMKARVPLGDKGARLDKSMLNIDTPPDHSFIYYSESDNRIFKQSYGERKEMRNEKADIGVFALGVEVDS